MVFWSKKQPTPKPLSKPTAQTLASIDDRVITLFITSYGHRTHLMVQNKQTLLELERECRTRHKQNIAQTVGSAGRVLSKSPIAVASIARSGLATSKTFVEHDEILKEVKRRGLTPLEQLSSENLYVMVAGQLVAVAIGHKMGEKIAHGVVEPIVTRFGGIAVERMTQKFTEQVVEQVAENVLSSAAINAHRPVDPFSAAPSGSATPSAAGAAGPTSSTPAAGSSRTSISLTTAVSVANAAMLMGRKTIAGVSNTVFKKSAATENGGSSSSSSTNALHIVNSVQSQHFSGEWVGIGEELEIAVEDNFLDENDIRVLKNKLAAMPEMDDAGHTKVAQVVARYRMKFSFQFKAHEFSGENLVDNLSVNGIIDDQGKNVDFAEMVIAPDGQEVVVSYVGKISGGLMIAMRGMKPASKGDYKRFDDYTLLRMEQESRKKHKMSVAKAVGAAAKVFFKSPIAVFGIAKTGFKAHQTYMDHDEILNEIKLRGLKPLEAEPQESIYIMVAGQLLAVFIGHRFGENVANSFVEPLVTRFGGAAVEKMSEKLAEHITEEASEGIFSNMFAKAHLRPNSAKQATSAGQPATQRPNSANSANSTNSSSSHLDSRPASTRPASAQSASSEVPVTPDASVVGHPGTLKPSRSATSLAALKEMATSVTAYGVSKATEMAQKYLTKPSVTSPSLQIISPLYSGEWTGFAEELEIMPVHVTESDEDHAKQDFGVHALFLKLSAGVTQMERTANGQKKEVICIARYRMRFLVQFEGSRVTGKNMVDDLAIVGQVQDAQSHFYFTEMAKESTGGQEITVYYQGGVVNDELVGEWVASDKRQGLFRLSRGEKIK
ncbi:hypothetical protein HDU81_001646 [Chytriomyces hyalinus]|nr:hypothetical protein HDU81_001646 [Chytriomyces hyalinus]